MSGDLSGNFGSTLEKSSSGNSVAMVLRSLPVSQGLSEFSESVSYVNTVTLSNLIQLLC